MPVCDFLTMYIQYLKGESNNDSFISDNFYALRDTEKNLLFSKELAIRHLDLLKEDISDIQYEKEDSHILLFYTHGKKPYIAKIRFDKEGKINSITEDIYRADEKMMVLVVEYDGSSYFGMQKQPRTNEITIQDEIEKALLKMTKKEVIITAASRTDRGVHAKGQVVQFDSMGIPASNYLSSLNDYLPKDIRVKNAYTRSQLFNCRYDVERKTYEYIIDMGDYSVFNKDYVAYYQVNNISRMREELKSLIGTHDFFSFSKGDKEDTVRTIYDASIHLNQDRLYLTFVGDGFLHNMIRLIVGSLLDIDKTGEGSIKVILDSKDKKLTSHMAPASGLYLLRINY